MVKIFTAPEVINPVDTLLKIDISTGENNNDEPNLDLFPLADIESDEPELESSLHLQQIFLLISCLELLWHDRHDYFAAGNLTIYYKQEQNKPPKFRGPDFFVALGTQKRHRKSWVVYHEGGIYPHVIVEILSDSTAREDRNAKKLLYQDIFRTPDYFWFHPETLEFQGFCLVNGTYEALVPNEQGWLWSQQLGLFLGIHDQKLRYFTTSGVLVASLEEARVEALTQAAEADQRLVEADQRAESAIAQVQAEVQRADEATQRAEKLAAKLRELNIDPEQI